MYSGSGYSGQALIRLSLLLSTLYWFPPTEYSYGERELTFPDAVWELCGLEPDLSVHALLSIRVTHCFVDQTCWAEVIIDDEIVVEVSADRDRKRLSAI